MWQTAHTDASGFVPFGGAWIFVKGAPERILDICSRELLSELEWLKILRAGALVFRAAELEKLVIRRTGLVARLTSSWKPGLREEAA